MYCFNCGKEVKENYKVCPYCGQNLEKITKTESEYKPRTYTVKAPNIQEDKQHEEKKERPCLITFIVVLLILITIIAIPVVASGGCDNCIDSCNSSCESCSATQITKKKPSISHEQTLTGVVVTIQAKDDYNFVTVKVEYLDSNGSVISSEELTGRNYKKGKTYYLKSTTSITNLINVTNYRCSVKNYG